VLGFIDVAEDYRHRRYPRQQPEPESGAADEINAFDRALAGDWSPVPQNHLAGLGLLLEWNLQDPEMTLSRGALEAAARAGWLLDPRIDGKNRVARAMTELLYRLDEVVRRDRRLGIETYAASEAHAEAIVRTAAMTGFKISPSGRGSQRFIGDEPYPGATAAIAAHFEELGSAARRASHAIASSFVLA
jgi:hypothetical protein